MKASKTAAATSAFPGATHLWESAFLLEHRATPSAPWHVICSVREPIAQAVSAFFHAQARERSGASEVPPDALRDRLVAERWLEHPAQWFERELTPSLGIDVFAHPFDTNAATAVIERGSVKLLLLRQEDLDRAPRALADFLQLGSPVQLSRRNDAASRHDAERYQAFLESVHLPADIVDATYASTFSRHFYSDVELAQLRSRWTAYRTKEATNKRGMR
jgi:hypothetical protein